MNLDPHADDPPRICRNWQRLNRAFVFHETPAGTIDGANVTFTLLETAIPGTVQLFKNGLLLKPTTDYSVSGRTITMVVAPAGGSVLLAHYQR